MQEVLQEQGIVSIAKGLIRKWWKEKTTLFCTAPLLQTDKIKVLNLNRLTKDIINYERCLAVSRFFILTSNTGM